MAIPQFADLPFIKNLARELLNSVSKYNSKGLQQDDTRLYQRKTLLFRDIIDSILPSMLIIDLNNSRKELLKYNDIVSSLKQLLGSDYTPSSQDLEKFSFSKLSTAEVDLLLSAINLAGNYLSSKNISISSKELQTRLNQIISESQSNTDTLKKAKALFNTPYKLTDITSNNKQVFVFPSFQILTGQVAKALEIGLEGALNIAQVSTFRFDTIGSILDFGHTATGYIEDNEVRIQFNSPKLFSILYDVLTNTNVSDPEVIARLSSVKFLEETKQVEEFVEVEKDFSEGFLKLFVSIGGNIVRFENSIINQRRGSVLESKETLGANRAVLQRLGKEFSSLGGKLATQISRSILIGRGSPSVIDYIKYSIINAIEGKQVARYKQKTVTKNSVKSRTKAPVLSGLTKKSPNIARTAKSKSRVIKTNLVTPRATLVSLELLLQGNLVEQIKQNMGTGNRRDVLNLRTGRFAESVKVERLSESRAGMITAFYSYMKNPYATFSQGGRQQNPASRDPKLLIARSIREIAQQQVQNKLRAVNV